MTELGLFEKKSIKDKIDLIKLYSGKSHLAQI